MPRRGRILDLVSVHDGELALTEIVAAGDESDEAVLRAVDDLARRRLLAERPGGYQVSHELLRRVVYDDLPLSARLDLHRRVALAVEAHRPDEVEVLAHHFATARIPDRAADYLERAADRALEVRAYDTAAFHLARAAEALDQIDAPAERHFRVAARQEEVLDVLARRTDQEAALGAHGALRLIRRRRRRAPAARLVAGPRGPVPRGPGRGAARPGIGPRRPATEDGRWPP